MEDVYKTTDKKNRFDENGREILNPTPMQPPIGYKKTPSIAEQIRQQVQASKLLAIQMEPETEEEADDFDIAEDPAPESRWENDMVPSIKESRAKLRKLEKEAALYARPKNRQDEPSQRTPAENAASPETPSDE